MCALAVVRWVQDPRILSLDATPEMRLMICGTCAPAVRSVALMTSNCELLVHGKGEKPGGNNPTGRPCKTPWGLKWGSLNGAFSARIAGNEPSNSLEAWIQQAWKIPST